jgi:hypothetical protein
MFRSATVCEGQPWRDRAVEDLTGALIGSYFPLHVPHCCASGSIHLILYTEIIEV